MEERYRVVRAPYRKKEKKELGYDYLDDERKAKKRPDYEFAANEELPEDDEEIFADPLGRKDWEKIKKLMDEKDKESKK